MIDYMDDGRGLSHDNIDALFKQSYTSKANKAQHGIGLSIIKMLLIIIMVQLHYYLLNKVYISISY